MPATGCGDEECAAGSVEFSWDWAACVGDLSSSDMCLNHVPEATFKLEAEESASEEAFDAVHDDTGGSVG